jgi:peptidoglycan hydrolase FlgJ
MLPPGASLASAATGQAAARAAGEASRSSPDRIQDAARQFEALLVEQILRAGRGEGEGWMGTGSDAAGECATGFAEQQFAAALAARGGLGLARLIGSGLEARGAADANRRPEAAASSGVSPALTR